MPSSRASRRAVRNESRSETLHVLVHDGRVEALRERVLADPLDQVRVHGAAGVDRALRVGSDDEQVRLLLLQVAADAGDRAAGADGDHDRVELAAGLLPDLRAGRAVVRLRVARVRVLVGLVRAGDLLGEPVGDEVVALGRVGVDRGRADHDLGAERAEQGDLLRRDLVGDDEDHLVALDRRRECEADAGVAGRRLDDRPARSELPALLGALDHAERDPILVRSARVQVLELARAGSARARARGAGGGRPASSRSGRESSGRCGPRRAEAYPARSEGQSLERNRHALSRASGGSAACR